MLFVVFIDWHVLGEEALETMFVGMECLYALVGNTAGATGGGAGATLVDLQVACLVQRLNLYAQVATRGASNLAQIHETGALETVEGYHDFQTQIVVKQRIDNGKLKCTHRS